MAIMTIDFQALDNSFLRPVVYDIIRQIKKVTRFPETEKIFFLDNSSDRPLQPGSAIGVAEVDPTGHDPMLRIEVNEEYNSDYNLAQVNRIYTDPHVFLDEELDVRMIPIYAQSTLTLSVKARFGSESQARAWRNGFRRATQNYRSTITHEPTYSFPIPREMLLLLTHIYKLRETNEPYGESMKEYLGPRFAKRVQTLVTQAGTNPTLVVTETQKPVIGFFDFSSQPEKAEKDGDRAVWEISFDYKVYMERPLSMMLKYPITVHNLSVSRKFLQLEERDPRTPHANVGYMTLLRKALTPMMNSYPDTRLVLRGLSIPYYDDWMPLHIELGSIQIARILITVDPTNPTDVINLHDLGEYTIDPLMLAYIDQYPDSVVTSRNNFIKITLYEKAIPLSGNPLRVDGDLNLTTESAMGLRMPFHLVLSGLVDLPALTDVAVDRLLRHGELCLKYVEALYDTIWTRMKKPTLLSDGSLSIKDWEIITGIIKRYFLPTPAVVQRIGRNVGQYFISVKRRSENATLQS